MSALDPANASSQPNRPSHQTVDSFTVQCEDRWQVYHRLQELDIRCRCKSFQPLKVDIETAAEAIQLWSIVRRVSHPRQVLVDALQQIWTQPCGTPQK